MRLLLIEDNQRLADYLATALQNGGFAVDMSAPLPTPTARSQPPTTIRCSWISAFPTWTASSGSATSAAAR